MVEKGKKNRSRREHQKAEQLTLKEKRKKKQLKKTAGDPLSKLSK